MGRPKKSASEKTGGPLPPTNGNHQDDDVKAMTFFGFAKRWQAAKDTLAIVEEEAKAKLGKHAVRDIRTWALLKDEKGEQKLKEKMRIARWLGLAMGTQAELFAEDRTPSVDRAYAEGKRDGLAGDPCKPDYAPELEQYRRYMDGFHEGQSVLAKGIKPLADGDERDLRPGFMQSAEAEKAGITRREDAVSTALGGAPATHKVVEAQAH
jgi:hypothetical protein